MTPEEKRTIAKAQIKYYQRRLVDEEFAKKHGDSERDFKRWLKNIYYPSISREVTDIDNQYFL